MNPYQYDIKLYQGSTYSQVITLYTDDTLTTPIDLTGYTARLKAKDGCGNELLDMTTENGQITLGGAAGTIQLDLTSTETEALSFDRATYDLELVNGTTVSRYFYGYVLLNPEITD